MKVLIIGGVAGGATAAARLRRLDENAEIILFERGEYISFANCGLPYYIGGEITDRSSLTVQTPEAFHARFRIDIRTFNEVIGIDPGSRVIDVKDLRSNEVYHESYDKLILAPGAAPLRPNLPGADLDRVFTLRNIPDTYRIKDYIDEKKPRRALVVGGGYIGVEMAENLVGAGLDVTVVEFADHVIAPLDYDMAAEVHNHLRQKGVHLILGDGVKSIEETGGDLAVTLGNGSVETDLVVLSVGVRPESGLAQSAGLAINPRGAVVVDEHMQTSVPDIYAVGDVVEIVDYVTGDKGYIPLAGPANKQARIAADNIAGIPSTYTGTQGTGILKVFDLTVGTTGMTETRAKQLGLEYDKTYTNSSSHASYYPGALPMNIKLVFEKPSGRILGAQIIGYEGVDKRIDVVATAMRARMTVFDLTSLELAYAPPYSSAKDPVNMAGYVAENLLNGRTRQFHWDEVAALPRDGSVTLLDIRPKLVYDLHHIEGFTHIEETELRDRLAELDPAKPIYLTCQIGLKGYSTCRMLAQKGYDCRNLAGGYRLWASILNPPTGNRANSESSPADPLLADTTPAPGKTEVVTLQVNACGLSCPGPIMKVAEAMAGLNDGDILEVQSSDPAFGTDIEAWSGRTGNTFIGLESAKGITTATLRKGRGTTGQAGSRGETGGLPGAPIQTGDSKNLIVFSGDLDKAIASFIIANASAAMGRKVTMFFTFWGLNILRKPNRVPVAKDWISRMFGAMMPRGSARLGLSRMNMGGMGAKMIRGVMRDKNIDSLEDLIQSAQKNGVELVACAMTMDVMGIKPEELIDGVKMGGAAAMLANAEESDMSLFI